MSTAAVSHAIPFVGLHYFDERDEALFFGRDEQIRDLLSELSASRFVTVIGSSGTGKSSLARAGLIPALRAGFLTGWGSDWRIVTTHPGGSPIRNLAADLEAAFRTPGVETTLRRGPLGVLEAVNQCGLGRQENLLVIVDQFEEIFRYQRESPDRQAAAEEAASFVKLLLEAAAHPTPPIFVLLTMRSEYLGACAQFRDLPERINRGLYLIPRMRRDQLEDAITGPAAVAGARFSPPLIQRLLNDAGEDPDQLPVLQHALLRTWLNWRQEGDSSQDIDFRHYHSTGGVRAGLDNHAEEIYAGLPESGKKIAEMLFRCLTERDPANNDIRRPTELRVIAKIAGQPVNQVAAIADRYRETGVSFLSPAAPVELSENTVLDITHESLIRKWRRLGGSRDFEGWVVDEAELREQYQDLAKRARRALPKQDTLTGADLEAALEWQARALPPQWGLRYEPAPDAFPLVTAYIERSEHAWHTRLAELELERRWRRISTVVNICFGLGFILLLPILVNEVLQSSDQDLTRARRLFDTLSKTLPWAAPYSVTYTLFAILGRLAYRKVAFEKILAGVARHNRAVRTGSRVRQREEERRISLPATREYATFRSRLLAYLIDLFVFLILGVVCVSLNIWTDSLGWTRPDSIIFIWVVYGADYLYQTLMIRSSWQATLGMKALGIIVTDLQGRRLSFWRAGARHLAKVLSYYSLVGMFLPLWTQKRQAVHDLIVRTLVIRSRAAKLAPANPSSSQA